jgi:hypothetical protein
VTASRESASRKRRGDPDYCLGPKEGRGPNRWAPTRTLLASRGIVLLLCGLRWVVARWSDLRVAAGYRRQRRTALGGYWRVGRAAAAPSMRKWGSRLLAAVWRNSSILS